MNVAVSQRIAAAACNDGMVDDGLQELASLGCHGKFIGNIERDFHRRLRPESCVPVREVELPLMSRDSQVPGLSKIHVMAPFDIIQTLHVTGSIVRCLVGRPMTYLSHFWESLKEAREPWVLQHPLVRNGALGQTIPLCVHADEGQYVNKDQQKA